MKAMSAFNTDIADAAAVLHIDCSLQSLSSATQLMLRRDFTWWPQGELVVCSGETRRD